MFNTKDEALKTHETLSKLHQENPRVFESTTRAMVENLIRRGNNPKVLKAIQTNLDNLKKKAVDEKLTALREHFNGGRN